MSIRKLKRTDGKPSFKADVKVGDKLRRTKTFRTMIEAQRWHLDTEEQLTALRGCPVTGVTFGDAIRRYQREVSPTKKGAKWEYARCDKALRSSLAEIDLLDISATHANEYIAELEQAGLKHSSITRELTLLKSIMHQCTEWYELPYPWGKLRKLDRGKSRDRLITNPEVQAIVEASGYQSETSPHDTYSTVGAIFLFAIETAMRLGEICQLTPSDIDFDSCTLTVLDTGTGGKSTKNGEDRDVPLSPNAMIILHNLQPAAHDKPIFRIGSGVASKVFERVRRRAGYENSTKGGFTFHDTRHLACTRLSRLPGMSILKLARITGHRDTKMLLRYYNEDMRVVAKELRQHSELMKDENAAVRQLMDTVGIEEAMRLLKSALDHKGGNTSSPPM